jgi:hypothetical protein
MSAKVVVLAGRSLFTEGVISKLRRSSLGGSFEVIDMCQPDPLHVINALHPDVIVVDGNDPEYCAKLKGNTFPNLSHLKMIFLDSQSARTRILQWEEHDTTQIADLLEEMSPATPGNDLKGSATSADVDKSHYNSNLSNGVFH